VFWRIQDAKEAGEMTLEVMGDIRMGEHYYATTVGLAIIETRNCWD